MSDRRKTVSRIVLAGILVLLLTAAGCSSGVKGNVDSNPVKSENRERTEADEASEDTDGSGGQKEKQVIGLILTSRDAGENESVTEAVQKLADETGAELLIRTPDVSAEEAEEAASLTYGSFILYDVDPIEYQMLALNELTAEDADVILIHPNHSEALDGVLSAARGAGAAIYTWGEKTSEGSFDVYEEEAEGLLERLNRIKKTY